MLDLAILGILHEAPMHGYELRKQLSAKLGAMRAAMSLTISWCTPVSTSGWYSARCGTP